MSLEACADLVRRGDPDRWLSLMAVPVPARARLLPLYAFNLELARAPWVSGEPMIGQMRLQWWRDVLEEIAEGAPPRSHEVATPLAELLSPEAACLLDGAAVARHWDLGRDPFADEAALWTYLEETGGALVEAAGLVLGAAPQGLRAAGTAGALAGFLRAVPQLKARGCWPLVSEQEAAITALARAGQARWRAAKAARPDRAAQPALLALWQTPWVLARAAKSPARVLDGGLERAPGAAKAALLWRQARGAW